MLLQGERVLQTPADLTYGRLSDASFLVTCIPDATVSGSPTTDVAQCSVRPNFTFARGSLDVTVTVTSRQPPAALTFLLASKGIGASADVEVTLALSDVGEQTKAVWTATVARLGGLLKAVPAGLIRGAAQKVIDEVWTGIETKLQEP